MDYSIGDRVEVLLEQKLHTAEVRAVYNSGKVDVVYDADASVGYLLSVAEHGLNKMWMPKKKGKGGGGKNAKVCSVGGCSNTVHGRGLCQTHCLKPCSVEGCTTKALARGVCRKHGAHGKCVKMGCVTNARKRGGHCFAHKEKVACAHPDCSTPLIPGKGVCFKHGAFGICTAWGCTTNAASGKKGLCFTHSKDKATCSASGCSNGVVARKLCSAHGARGFCSTAGCNTGAVKDGMCYKHGEPKKKGKGGGGKNAKVCSVDGCSNTVHARGLCAHHDRKPCVIEGCTTKAIARGLCGKHGANGKCVQMGCVTNAQKRGGHCFAHSKKVACAAPNCSTPLIPGKGVCTKHGAFGICTAWGCKTNAAPGKKGHCFTHSKNKPTCSTSDCSNVVVARGLCEKHGARGFCSTAGCDTGALKDGLCYKHGENAKVCPVDGCPNTVNGRRLCSTHCRKPCSVEGCTTKAIARGLCSKHGAKGKCVTMGCVTNARKRGGYCGKHSKKVACAHPDCSTPLVVGRGVCVKHGAFGICTAWGCTTNAASGKKGLCFTHSKDKATCSASGCSNGVVARKLCSAHGARGFCSTAGCNTGAVKDGMCYKHGVKKICTFDDCTTAAQSRGLCVRHGGGSMRTTVCDIEGCKTLAVARSRCVRHGAFGWCKVDGCTTPAAKGFEHCIKHGGGKKKKPCSVAGCTTPSERKGLCCKHGGGKDECKIAGCTSQSYGFLKTCRTHGGSGYCQHPSGCITPATKYGANCTKHTKKEKKD